MTLECLVSNPFEFHQDYIDLHSPIICLIRKFSLNIFVYKYWQLIKQFIISEMVSPFIIHIIIYITYYLLILFI